MICNANYKGVGFHYCAAWSSSDGYTWKGYWMIHHHGGLNYGDCGSRVIVGWGSAALEGIFSSTTVRNEVIMR